MDNDPFGPATMVYDGQVDSCQIDSDPSGLATMVYGRQAPAYQVAAIENLVPNCCETFVGWAKRLIHRYHVVDSAYGAEDAVQDALLKLWRSLNDGKLGSVDTVEQFVAILRCKLHHEILHERRRERTKKRGRCGVTGYAQARSAQSSRSEFEPADAHASPPDEAVSAKDAIESLLKHLDGQNTSLRAVAAAIAEGLTQPEIAARLRLSLWSAKHKVSLIRAILEKYDPMRD